MYNFFRCQLREKVLAEAATTFILVADERKDSKILGSKWKQGIPIEVAPFAWAIVFQSLFFLSTSSLLLDFGVWVVRLLMLWRIDLQKMGCEKPTLRMGKMKAGPVVTDNG